MAPIVTSAGASPPPPDNRNSNNAGLSLGVTPRQRQMKMSAGEGSRFTGVATKTKSFTATNGASSSSSSTSAFVPSVASELLTPELYVNVSPLSTVGDYAPLNVFMESYKNRFQQQQQQQQTNESLQLTRQQQQTQVMPHKQEAIEPMRTKSVSPKCERDATSTTITDPSLSSSHPEEDSSDSSTTKKVFKCPFPGCGKEFQLKGNLKRHQNIHNGDKKFRCKFCGKDFLRKADMEVHHRVHTGEKPYQCKFADCDKSFARRSDLLSHERTHVGTKPFACLYPGCERHFARKFDLQKHQRMHDNHSSECQKRRKISSPLSSTSDDCNCWPEPTVMDAFVDEPETLRATPPPLAASASIAPAAAPRLHQQHLTCTQDHIHSPPACFAGFTPDLLDSFLLSSREAFDAKPYPNCCGFDSVGLIGQQHTHPSIKQQLEALEIGAEPTTTAEVPIVNAQSTANPGTTSAVAVHPPAPQSRIRSTSVSSTSSSTTSCPMDAELLKAYNKHTPSCGHLSILHGNHRDYVVKNHLVCQDSVRSIGGGEHHALKPASKCPTDEPHRPGCGHLPVRHRDHIDYVVEDNLFCQQAGMLDVVGADSIELLDDDFWEFYGAIGSLNND